MGKGDQKTARGKRKAGSYGKTRPQKSASKKVVVAKEKAPKPAEPKAEKPKKVAKPVEEPTEAEEKPKTTRKKKTEE